MLTSVEVVELATWLRTTLSAGDASIDDAIWGT